MAVLAAFRPNLLPPSHARQQLTHAILRYLEGGEPWILAATGCPHIYPMQFANAQRRYWVLLNASSDPAQPFMRGPVSEHVTVSLLKPLEKPGPWESLAPSSASGGKMACPYEIPSMGFAVFARNSSEVPEGTT